MSKPAVVLPGVTIERHCRLRKVVHRPRLRAARGPGRRRRPGGRRRTLRAHRRRRRADHARHARAAWGRQRDRSAAAPMRVLHVGAEIFPFVKTGGLADVSARCRRRSAQAGADARVLLPGLPALRGALRDARVVADRRSRPGAVRRPSSSQGVSTRRRWPAVRGLLVRHDGLYARHRHALWRRQRPSLRRQPRAASRCSAWPPRAWPKALDAAWRAAGRCMRTTGTPAWRLAYLAFARAAGTQPGGQRLHGPQPGLPGPVRARRRSPSSACPRGPAACRASSSTASCRS